MPSQNNYDVRLVRLDEITILNAQINNKPGWVSLPKEQFKSYLTHNFELATNFAINSLRLVHTANIEMSNKETDSPLAVTGKFGIAYFFSIENFKDIFDEEIEDIIADNIATSLINICYPTSRGIIFTRCQGTIMKDLILPILPTDEIAKFQKELIDPPSLPSKPPTKKRLK